MNGMAYATTLLYELQNYEASISLMNSQKRSRIYLFAITILRAVVYLFAVGLILDALIGTMNFGDGHTETETRTIGQIAVAGALVLIVELLLRRRRPGR